MAANSINPKTVTDALLALIQTALVPTDIAQEVIDYWTANLDGQISVAMILYAGEDPQSKQLDGSKLDTWVHIEIHVWVLYKHDASSWTPSNAETRRAAIATAIKNVVVDNRGKAQNANVPWDFLTFDGRSNAGDVNDDNGAPYLLEIIPLKARTING
jgi:hypothetical protein